MLVQNTGKTTFPFKFSVKRVKSVPDNLALASAGYFLSSQTTLCPSWIPKSTDVIYVDIGVPDLSFLICTNFSSFLFEDYIQGDTGGPLVCGEGMNLLAGIVSWGIGCGKGPQIYTKVTQFQLLTFGNTFVHHFSRCLTSEIGWILRSIIIIAVSIEIFCSENDYG